MVLNHFPAMPHVAAIYIVFLMQTTQSIAAINSTMHDVKWAQSKSGTCRYSLTDDTIIKELVESASRIRVNLGSQKSH